MVLSVPRSRAQAPVDDDAFRVSRPTWAMERGASCWTSVADVAGAFPGFTRQGGLLAGSRVRVTERYLLVDEGRGHGFGLPLAAIRGIAIGAAAESGARQKAGLHISYHDGVVERCFLIRPRADRLAWSRDRFDEALRAFRLAGHAPRMADPAPSLLISWEQARRCRSENVIWSGRATAPLDPLGLIRASADVWLTTRSLMWSAGPEHGINRVAIERIVDVLAEDLSDQAATPVLVVGYQSNGPTRRDLVFIFDRNLPVERNGRERGAILVSFRSRGIELGTAPGFHQPWRRDWWPAYPAAIAPSLLTGEIAPEPASEIVSSTAEAVTPAPAAERPEAPHLPLARAFEAEALSLLAEANARAHDLLPAGEFPVLAASLSGALAEIEAAEANGALTPEQAAARRATLLALSEAGSRLRALVRLCQSGQISGERLEERRQAILRPLTLLIATQSQPASPTPPHR